MLNNPFNIHRANVEVLKEDPAHYAAIARNNAAKQAERDKKDPEAAKKREKAKDAINKKFSKNPVTPGNKADMRNPTGSMVGTRESTMYVIPEEIPANERTAFHGAAAAAAKQNKKSFEFGGKTHPVTMKKDLATKIADQKESMSFREKLLSLYENDRAKHYKGATEPEGMHDKSKSSKGAMDMLNIPKSTEADGMKAAKDTAANIAKSAPGKKMRSNDKKDGDNTIIPAATPVNDPSGKTQTMENYGVSGNKVSNTLLDAIAMVEDMDKVHTVDIDHMTGTAGSHEKKHGITLKKGKNYGKGPGSNMATDATGTKANLQKYLKKHYDGDHKAMHPEIYK